VSTVTGIAAPRATPVAIVERLDAEINARGCRLSEL
jgi:hypothetical protein